MKNTIRFRAALLPALIMSFSLFVTFSRALAQDEAGSFVPSACEFKGPDLGVTTLSLDTLGFECGFVVVPVRHENPDGPTLRLPVAIRRAPGGAPDPLLLAQGGPGGDAFEIFSLLVPGTPIAADRDIVIFNQRGTPYAVPELSCPETEDRLAELLAADSEEGERIYNEAIQACYDRLTAEGIDLSAFNSLENAADIPFIARALGYDTYNFYGVSYGTLLGLHLMRNYPDGLRSVILDSVVTTDINFVAELPVSEERVFSEVFAACAADPLCNDQYPNLPERFYDLIHRLDEEPVMLQLTDPETGKVYDAFLNGRGLRSLLYQLLYVPRMNVVLPKLVSDLEQGDYRYLESMWPLLAFDQLVSEGMYFSVLCAEDADIDVTSLPLETLQPEIAATAVDDLQSYIDTCHIWQVDQLPAPVDDPVTSDIPTLLLSGRFDPVTPPAFAAAAASGLANSTRLIDQQASHGVAFLDPCVNEIMVAFLNNPDVRPDSTCLDNPPSVKYVPVDAITMPILAEVNSLNPQLLVQFGLAGLLLMVVLSPFVVWPIVFFVRALSDKQIERPSAERRLRWTSRGLILAFGVLALIFSLGLLGFIVSTLADQSLATALALPSSAAVLLWLPGLMVVLAFAIVIALVAMWRVPGSGSVTGKVYYTVVTISAVALLILIGTQGLLLPPI